MSRLSRSVIALRRVMVLPGWVRRVDARTSRAINRQPHPRWLDRSLMRLSWSANRSVLWILIALGLYGFGGSRRRAAVRGVGSLVVGSALANLVGKRIFGGDRPLLKDVPLPRRLKTFPTSASFPSGHSASAAAFVTGAALESRRTGILLAPLGAAVAYSRLHTGAHWLSDVVGGAMLGSAVAAAGRALVPARPRVEPRRSAPQIELPALPDGSAALIIVNPSSGIDPLRPDPVQQLTELLPAARLHVMESGDDIAAILDDALASQNPPRALGIYGGDGSVSAAADAARRSALPLAVFPGGTFNHFARSAGIPTVEAGVEAVRTGAGRRVDVGTLTLEGNAAITVLNAASVGVYPDFVATREPMEKRLGKPVAAFVAAVKVLAWAETIDVTVDGRPARVWSVSVATGETSSASMVPLQRRHLDDGVLDVRVLHARTSFPRLRGLVALVFGLRASALLDRLPGRPVLATVESFRARTLQIEVDGRDGTAPGFGHDGEVSVSAAPRPGGGYAASITVVPGGLDVYSLGPDTAV